MKRSATGESKSAFDRMMPSKAGKWSSEGEGQLWVYTSDGCEPRSKIASFDMDGTLILTKSGNVFPKDTNDWKLIYEVVPKKLKEYHTNGYKIVIFSNQKGLKAGKVDKEGFKRKIERIVATVKVPMQVFLSVDDGYYRKPSVGMWEALKERNGDTKLDLTESFYVGDAAGRHKTKNRSRKDHSCADRFFAHNVGLPFHTPEQFFLEDKSQEPWGPPTFEPTNLFLPNRVHLEPDTKLPSEKPEIIVMCGFPGSGKSTLALKLSDKYGYEVVNRDTLGTWQKCVAHAEKFLKEGKSVVVDNTNPDKESRSRYTALAKKLKLDCRCFEINCTIDHARHNVRFRSLTQKRPNEVNTMVLRMFQSKFQPPSLEEGFSEIIKVNIMPEFASEDHKKLYMQYLIE